MASGAFLSSAGSSLRAGSAGLAGSERRGSLPEIAQSAHVYHGPPEPNSAWSAWDRTEGENERRIRYCVFRNRQWGTTVELDYNSNGAFKSQPAKPPSPTRVLPRPALRAGAARASPPFRAERYTRDDHDFPNLVEPSGRQRQVEGLSAPRIASELRAGSRTGSLRMTAPVERHGMWTAAVEGRDIVLTQAAGLSSAARLRLRLVLSPDALEFYGQSASHTTAPAPPHTPRPPPAPAPRGAARGAHGRARGGRRRRRRSSWKWGGRRRRSQVPGRSARTHLGARGATRQLGSSAARGAGGGGDVLGELRRSMCQVGWRGQQNSCLAAATAVLIQTATPFLLLARCL